MERMRGRQEEAGNEEEEEEEERVLRNRRLWSFKMAGPEERRGAGLHEVQYTLTVYLEIGDATNRPTDRPNERRKRQAGWMDLPTSCQIFVSLGCRLSAAATAAPLWPSRPSVPQTFRFTKHLCRK